MSDEIIIPLRNEEMHTSQMVSLTENRIFFSRSRLGLFHFIRHFPLTNFIWRQKIAESVLSLSRNLHCAHLIISPGRVKSRRTVETSRRVKQTIAIVFHFPNDSVQFSSAGSTLVQN